MDELLIDAILEWPYIEWATLSVTLIAGFWIGRLSKKKVKKTTVVIEKPRAQKPTDAVTFIARVKENRGV